MRANQDVTLQFLHVSFVSFIFSGFLVVDIREEDVFLQVGFLVGRVLPIIGKNQPGMVRITDMRQNPAGPAET